ncbi:MAG: type III-A CRISPR-associated protein Csm2 [Bacteroidales bacterium]|nr:type III-A CRISPR-associated protein Csm2 [Bacteroidales bacterium]
MRGRVRNVNVERGFGFITSEDGNDYYFNEDSLTSGLIINDCQRNVEIEFDITKQQDGRTKAINCRIPEHESVKYFKESALVISEKKELYDLFCDYAKKYAERLASGEVTTSMIRKIYARILNARSVEDIKLLRPHFAYTSGRNEKVAVLREFMDLLDYLAKKMEINNEQHLSNYKRFVEAIVAYRKYVGNDK